MSDTISSLIVWRFVQALGTCAGVALSRAMVRDLYDGNRAAQMLSTLMTVMAIAPLFGPVIGGQILSFSGWRATASCVTSRISTTIRYGCRQGFWSSGSDEGRHQARKSCGK